MSTTMLMEASSNTKKFRRDRLSSTIGAFCLMIKVSLGAGFGFLVVPGAAHFGVPTAQFLLWYSIYTLTVAATYLAIGSLIGRIGARTVVVGGGVIVSASLVGMAFAPSLGVFYVLAAFLGFGWSGCSMLAANTVVTGWHQHARKGTVIGIVAAGMGVGGLSWGFIFPAVVAAGGMQGTLLLMAALAACFAILPGLFLIKNPPKGEDLVPSGKADGQSGRPARSAKMTGVGLIVALLIGSTFVLGLEGAFSQVMPAVFSASGVEPAHIGLLVSLWALSGLIAKPVLGYLADKLGMLALYIILAVMFIVSLPGMALFGSQGGWVFFALIPVAALAMSIQTVVIPLVVTNTVGSERFPVVYGYTLTSVSVAAAIAVPLWGLVFDMTGSYNLALLVGGAVGFIGLTLAFATMLLSARSRQRHSVSVEQRPGDSSVSPENSDLAKAMALH